jgi:hypothetical protein
MDGLIYTLCAVTAGLCAFFLLRGYLRTHMRLLLWSGMCFLLFGVSNLLNVVNHWWLTSADLMVQRLLVTLLGVMLLIYGLVWERE